MLCLMLMGGFQGIQGGDGNGWMITLFKGQELKEEAPAGPLGGDNPEDAPGSRVEAGWGEGRRVEVTGGSPGPQWP